MLSRKTYTIVYSLTRERVFIFYCLHVIDQVYYIYITRMIRNFRVKHKSQEYRPFFENTKRNLKTIPLHNGNKHVSVHIVAG